MYFIFYMVLAIIRWEYPEALPIPMLALAGVVVLADAITTLSGRDKGE